jgi:hypothetical protein
MLSELDRWDCSAAGLYMQTCRSSISATLAQLRGQALVQGNLVRRTCIIPTTLGGPLGMVTLGFQLLTKYPALAVYCSINYNRLDYASAKGMVCAPSQRQRDCRAFSLLGIW